MAASSIDAINAVAFHEFMEHTPIAAAHIDADGTVHQTNASFRALMDGIDTPNFSTILNEQDRLKFLHQLQGAATSAISSKSTISLLPLSLALHLHGTIKSAYTYISALYKESYPPVILIQMIDQTEQKNLEMRFSHSQKMQAVGQLAGGVAHDFNNLLTAMIGFCDLLLMRHPAGDPSFADIMQVKQNANRAANLVRQLLAFSRKQTLQPTVLDIGDVLAEISNLIRRLIGENIRMDLVHGKNIGAVYADQGQLEQVLINLAVNARDAMTAGGTLSILTSNVSITPDHTVNASMIAPSEDDVIIAGDYVLVEVSDTGTGIPQEIIKDIFEPFYSTKEVGSGTGLGLSTCYGIIKQTGGYMYVASELGKGTTFYVYLKRVAANAQSALPEISADAPAHDLTGTAKILLVEDETPVRIFAARALRNKGYEVIEADSGETAIDAFTKHAGSIDLILSDVIMPGLTGPAAIVQLEKQFPEAMKRIKVVFISGYAEDAFADAFGNQRAFDFLPKPFTLKQLAGKVKDVLSGSASTTV